MARVIIDPGHGGAVAVGGSSPFGASAHGSVEKHVNLELARRVASRLGSVAQLTRESDVNVSLRERADLAARSGARALVSIHAGGGGRGSEVWLHDQHEPGSAELAHDLHSSLERVGPTRGVFRGPLAVLDPGCGRGVAACLIEADNLGDVHGHRRLTEPHAMDALADAIATGVRRYMARLGDPLSSTIAVREVSDNNNLSPRYRGDQNLGVVTFHGYMRPGLDFVNRFIWLVWPQRRRPDDSAPSVDIDLRIDLFDRDPQQDPTATPIDTQRRRVQLTEGVKFGFEYSRLPEGLDIYVRIQFTDYSAQQDAGQVLWTNGYGGSRSLGHPYGDPQLVARCYSRQMTVPAGYEAFEAEVRDQWIATCVTSRTDNLHFERRLVNGNPSLRRVWDAVHTLPLGSPITLNAAYTFDANGVTQAIEFSSNVSVVDFSNDPDPPIVAPLSIDGTIDRTLAAIRARKASGETAYQGTSLNVLECLCVKAKDPAVNHHVIRGDLYTLNKWLSGHISLEELLLDFRATFQFAGTSPSDTHLLNVLVESEDRARGILDYLIRRKTLEGIDFAPRLLELSTWVASRIQDPRDIYSCWNY